MSGPILVTGATGNQGGAVVRALLELAQPPKILALTRSASSQSAQNLAAKSSLIKIVQGDLDDVDNVFSKAREAAGEPIWGVYSVQAFGGGESHLKKEVAQGKALVDNAVKHGVKHLVYSSVDRGGDERSWSNPTHVPHFKSKHEIELYLREKTKNTTTSWTILRPVAFMDNFQPGMQTRVFLAALQSTMGEKPLQYIAVRDIGIFAARAFENPGQYSEKAIALAGDEMSVEQVGAAFKEATGQALTPTFLVLGNLLHWAVGEMGAMMDWFRDEGYAVDIPALRKAHPGLLDMKTWVLQESKFESRP